ncbi:MAG: hypothetical protein PHD82_13035 [Candidatus Riflebacteria bacterium]|nr:hypothetical protein [Candidatus Riflebacteria bacterium]
MSHRSRIVLTLLGLALLLQSSNLFYAFFTRVFPLSARLSPWLRAGTATFMVGTFYYLTALAAFFMQKPIIENEHGFENSLESNNETVDEITDSETNNLRIERLNACEFDRKTLLIAGRPFKIDRSIMNPANHLVLSTILLFCALATVLASQLPA